MDFHKLRKARGTPKRTLMGAAFLLFAASLTGCGEGDEPAEAKGAELVPVKVGVSAIADVAPLYIGISKGYFRDAGLDVDAVQAESGAALLPAVVRGDFDFGFANGVSIMLAQSEGLKLRAVAQASLSGATPDGAWDPLLVREDSGIRTPKDLEGKTVAVSALHSISEILTKAALDKAGAESSKVKFVEVPYPDMNAAVDTKRVDGAAVPEPFATVGKQTGLRKILDPFYDTEPHLPIALYFTMQQFAEKNPDLVEDFVEAMNKSLTYAAEHPDEVRALIPTYTKIDAELSQKIVLPEWAPGLVPEKIEILANLMHKYGLTDEVPDVKSLVGQ